MPSTSVQACPSVQTDLVQATPPVHRLIMG
jgi:hypothetical protein